MQRVLIKLGIYGPRSNTFLLSAEMSVEPLKVRYYGNKARHEHPAKGLPRHPAPGRHVEPPPRDDDGRQDGHGKNTWNSRFGPTGGRNEIDHPDSIADDEQGVRYHIRKN